MPRTFIGLGSNLGDRRANLAAAVRLLCPGVRVGPIFETNPIGGTAGQPDFLNTVAELQTDLPVESLLSRMLEVESQLGRARRERNGPRTIDLDILLFGQEIVRLQNLEVPHPRMHFRGFVLAPLVEIAPEVIHPVLGLTVRALYENWVESGSTDRVVRVEDTNWVREIVDLRH